MEEAKTLEETVFFSYEDVKVTNARFVNGTQTFAMRNVTSVSTMAERPSQFWPAAGLFLGFALLFVALPLGVLVIAAMGYLLHQAKPIYHVMLTTAGGEVSALRSRQQEYVAKVITALNAAIIHRG